MFFSASFAWQKLSCSFLLPRTIFMIFPFQCCRLNERVALKREVNTPPPQQHSPAPPYPPNPSRPHRGWLVTSKRTKKCCSTVTRSPTSRLNSGSQSHSNQIHLEQLSGVFSLPEYSRTDQHPQRRKRKGLSSGVWWGGHVCCTAGRSDGWTVTLESKSNQTKPDSHSRTDDRNYNP